MAHGAGRGSAHSRSAAEGAGAAVRLGGEARGTCVSAGSREQHFTGKGAELAGGGSRLQPLAGETDFSHVCFNICAGVHYF